MDKVEVVFDASAFSVDAIQRAAYVYTESFTLDLVCEPECFRCVLRFADDTDDAVVDAFRSEVLDQVLRERIRSETEAVRNLVLALAFSKTELSSDS